MTDNDLLPAQSRVREMNRMARQYVNRSNSYMRAAPVQNTNANAGANANAQNKRNGNFQTRFEPVAGKAPFAGNKPVGGNNPFGENNPFGGNRPRNANPLFGAHPRNTPPANRAAGNNPFGGSRAQGPQNTAGQPPPPVQNRAGGKKPNPLGIKLPFNLNALNLNMDEERLIIMALILLLYKEKADIKLLLALGYLVL